ncbi:hypothetical protein RhiJN_27681 [Ceratobasidium sp. AG-Ba]|nr:hypothetical protein RhiJN_13649 [Ceratobasidium sp. AG-Ba]QRV99662.1 hypothetical protein RhiJN_27681 [Ceratobasidium sp. AG-Ba]QRW14199.1 hypothetical protein RhiLY_13198 [Ceratobasidium sp. AG-Ba]
MALKLAAMKLLGLDIPKSARPVAIGDTLSFDPHPDKYEDLIECVVQWKQNLQPRSEKYITFKATNQTAGDTEPLVPVFVQKSYYDKLFGSVKDLATFQVTTEWQYGQADKTGANRFVVLHDRKNRPYQHRFVANLVVELDNLVHDALCAAGHAEIADKLDDITETYFGEFLHSYNSIVVQSGDLLLVPSEQTAFGFGAVKNVAWWQTLITHKTAEYYCFTVPNQTQKGQDVMFFIQKDWWDPSNTGSDHHISKVATKNKNGQYEFRVDAKCQYGESDRSGKYRWVVYHDQTRDPYQHSFINAMLAKNNTPNQTQVISGIFGLTLEQRHERLVDTVERWFGDYLHTFPQTVPP